MKAAIRKERRAHVADADEHHWLQAARAQQVDDHLRELVHVVAEAARAELAEVGEVLAQLRGFDARDFRQRLAGDSANVVRLEPLEAAQIDGQTINRLARDLWAMCFFQGGGELSQSCRGIKLPQSTNISSFESSNACA